MRKNKDVRLRQPQCVNRTLVLAGGGVRAGLMRNLKDAALLLLAFAVISLLSYFAGYIKGGKSVTERIVTDTVNVVDTDTVPVLTSELDIQDVPEPFPVYITVSGDTVRDTVFVPVPVTQRVYEGGNYKAYVSGYKPKLDSISIYNNYIYVKEDRKRFGVGAGVGLGIGRGGVSPCISVSLYYKLFEF